jgi:hypothetical protein
LNTAHKRLSIAALAATAASLLSATTATALPPFPEDPAPCANWVLHSNTLTVRFDNGSQAYIPWDQDGGKDTALLEGGTFPATLEGGGETWHGQPVGEVDGDTVDFTVTWVRGDQSMNSHFHGKVVDLGTARGHASDSRGNQAEWVGAEPFTCADPPKQDTPPPAEQQSTLATITDAVDVYTDPGGAGQPIGSLPKGTKVTVLERRDDNWVHFSEALLNKKIVGWVCGDFVANP